MGKCAMCGVHVEVREHLVGISLPTIWILWIELSLLCVVSTLCTELSY